MPSKHRPIANVHTCNSISVPTMSTSQTTEDQTSAVIPVNMPTTRTSSTGIPRIDQFKVNPPCCGFVGNEELTHGIWPTMDTTSESSSLLNTGCTDVSQVFHHYPSGTHGFRPSYKAFGGNMQEMFGYGSFVPRHPFQESMTGTSANRLYLGSAESDAIPTMVEFTSLEGECFAVGGVGGGEQSLDTGINSDYTTLLSDFRYFNFMGQDQIPCGFDPLQLGVLPRGNWWNVGMYQGDRMLPKSYTLGTDSKVPADDNRYGGLFEDGKLPFLVDSHCDIGGGNLPEDGEGKLGSKFELLPDCGVMFFGQGNPVCILGLVDDGGSPVAGGKILGAVLVKEDGSLLDFYLDCPDCFHYIHASSKNMENPSFIFCGSKIVKKMEEVGSLTPTLKMSGFPLTNI